MDIWFIHNHQEYKIADIDTDCHPIWKMLSYEERGYWLRLNRELSRDFVHALEERR